MCVLGWSIADGEVSAMEILWKPMSWVVYVPSSTVLTRTPLHLLTPSATQETCQTKRPRPTT